MTKRVRWWPRPISAIGAASSAGLWIGIALNAAVIVNNLIVLRRAG